MGTSITQAVINPRQRVMSVFKRLTLLIGLVQGKLYRIFIRKQWMFMVLIPQYRGVLCNFSFQFLGLPRSMGPLVVRSKDGQAPSRSVPPPCLTCSSGAGIAPAKPTDGDQLSCIQAANVQPPTLTPSQVPGWSMREGQDKVQGRARILGKVQRLRYVFVVLIVPICLYNYI